MTSIWHQIAGQIVGRATDAAPAVERYKVRRADPLLMEEMGGDNVLQDGDDDLVYSRAFVTYMGDPGLVAGDVVRVIYDDEEFTAIAVDD